eukprot:956322-Amphidinium_carterae.1
MMSSESHEETLQQTSHNCNCVIDTPQGPSGSCGDCMLRSSGFSHSTGRPTESSTTTTTTTATATATATATSSVNVTLKGHGCTLVGSVSTSYCTSVVEWTTKLVGRHFPQVTCELPKC